MGYNSFHRFRNDLSDRGLLAKRQREEGGTGREPKVPCTEKWGRKRVLPPTASELDAVQILREKSGEGKRIVVDDPALDEEEKTIFPWLA